MTSDVMTALLALCGTLLGSGGGILAANRLSNYRIAQLELKVDKHNCIIDRMYKAEERLEEIDVLYGEKFRVANHRIEDLEKSD